VHKILGVFFQTVEFGIGFGLFEELSSCVEVELFEVVESLSVGGVVGDKVAFVDQGIEILVEQGTDFGRGTTEGFGGYDNTSV